MKSEVNSLYEFGGFRFDGGTHRLWQDKELILLSPKASELLKCLLERAGEFVSKEEIFDYVWANTFVEEGVLTQNIYTLRKILGNGTNGKPLIENRAKLGYRIAVPVRFLEKPNVRLQSLNANGRKNPLAAQTRTEIITEKIFEEVHPKKLSRNALENWEKITVGLTVVLILLTVVGFFGWRFWGTQTETVSRTVLENVRFQKVVDTGDALFPTISPDGNLVGYKKADGVYVKDLRNGTETKLQISNVKRYGYLKFSKDNNFLYLKNRASFFLPSNIVKVSRFGGVAETIAENVWSGFNLSPDEKQIAFARVFPNENRQALVVKNLESGDERELYSLNFPQEFPDYNVPAWSPDGRRIANIIQRQNQGFLKIATTDTASGQTEDLFLENFQDVSQIVWLPKRDAFAAVAREEKNFQIWEISRSGRQIRRLVNDLNNYRWLTITDDETKLLTTQMVFFANLWLLDEKNAQIEKQITFGTSNRDGYNGIDCFTGGEIVYASNEGAGGETNLWRVNPNDNQRRQLTTGAGSRNDNPSISPDGKFIYFTSNRNGKNHIWRIEPNGENPQQITLGETTDETFPQISPDGKYLYFIRREAKSSAVWRKFISDNHEEKITSEKQFAPTNFLALSPDGKYLAFQNLTEQIDTENNAQAFQIAVIETAKPQTVKFFSVGGSKVAIYWTADSAAFDVIVSVKGKDQFRRFDLNESTRMQIVREFPKENLFTIARAKDSKTMVVSRGQRQYDAVLLTNFE